MGEFGASVGLDGNILIGGASMYDGAVVDAEIATIHCISCPGQNYCVSTSNSTGAPATISACGSRRISTNDLALVAHSIPTEPYLLFGGANQVQLPFGDGFQCAGVNIVRLHAPAFPVGSSVMQSIDFAAIGLTTAQTIHVQGWFRDPAAGGSGWNLTDGLALNLLP
ncbi:MAG: hypothetical protein ACI841_002908 [Planctomycetota bacterium]|jgi:hypothetical protein